MSQNWRWRVLTAEVLPACSRRDTIIAPNQASQLSGAVEIRMWSAADAQQQRRSAPVKPENEPSSSTAQKGRVCYRASQPQQILTIDACDF